MTAVAPLQVRSPSSTRSFIPRPFSPPVVDHLQVCILQVIKTEGRNDLGTKELDN